MDKKKLIILIAAGVLAILLLSVLIVGLTDGIWPWDGPAAYAKVFQFNAQEKPLDTAEPTDPSSDEGGESAEPGNTDSAARNPVIEGDENTKTEVDLGGNSVEIGNNNQNNTNNENNNQNNNTENNNTENNNTENNNTENNENSGNTGNTSDAPDADVSASGTQIPGWGN